MFQQDGDGQVMHFSTAHEALSVSISPGCADLFAKSAEISRF
jgi:hypothetical protein